MYLILLDPNVQKQLEVFPRYDGYYLKLNIHDEQKLVSSLIQEIQRSQMAGIEPVLFTSRNEVRFAIARMVHKYNIPIAVISDNELVQGVALEQVGMVTMSEES